MDELEHLIASKCCQMQKVKYYMIHLHEKSRIGQSLETKSRFVFFWSLGAEETGEGLLMDIEVPFGVMKMCQN